MNNSEEKETFVEILDDELKTDLPSRNSSRKKKLRINSSSNSSILPSKSPDSTPLSNPLYYSTESIKNTHISNTQPTDSSQKQLLITSTSKKELSDICEVIINPKPSQQTSIVDYNNFEHEGEPALWELFNKTRFVRGASCCSYFLLILWFPFGLIWAFFRCILLFTVGMPLLTLFNLCGGEWFFWKTLGRFFGFYSVITNPKELASPSEVPIITLNHITDFDGIAFLGIVPGNKLIVVAGVFLNPLIKWARILCWKVKIIIRQTDPAKRHQTRDEIMEFLNGEERGKRQLLVLAEGATTSGKVGLLLYNRFIFTMGLPVQPIALRVNTHLPLVTDIPSKTVFNNLYFHLFCPFVTFKFTALPVQYPLENESAEEFAKRVQTITANHLGIACTTYSFRHKNAWRKVVR